MASYALKLKILLRWFPKSIILILDEPEIMNKLLLIECARPSQPQAANLWMGDKMNEQASRETNSFLEMLENLGIEDPRLRLIVEMMGKQRTETPGLPSVEEKLAKKKRALAKIEKLIQENDELQEENPQLQERLQILAEGLGEDYSCSGCQMMMLSLLLNQAPTLTKLSMVPGDAPSGTKPINFNVTDQEVKKDNMDSLLLPLMMNMGGGFFNMNFLMTFLLAKDLPETRDKVMLAMSASQSANLLAPILLKVGAIDTITNLSQENAKLKNDLANSQAALDASTQSSTKINTTLSKVRAKKTVHELKDDDCLLSEIYKLASHITTAK
jgi:hypothetical protein